MAIAGGSLKANITTLGPLVLPVSEQLLFFVNLICRKVAPPTRPPAFSPIHSSPHFHSNSTIPLPQVRSTSTLAQICVTQPAS